MKKYYLKYKILVNGFSVNGDYAIDGFILKEGIFDKKMFEKRGINNETGVNVNMNLCLLSCLTDCSKLTYRYFESDDYYEIEVSNKTTRHTLDKVLNNNEVIIGRVLDLEMKIRIIFNIPVLFQAIDIEFYDEKKERLDICRIIRPISNWNRLMYVLPKEEFYNNSRFNLDIHSVKSTNNNNFNRVL